MPKIIPSAKGIRSSNQRSSFYLHEESVTQFPQSKWSLRKMTIETCFVSEKLQFYRLQGEVWIAAETLFQSLLNE